MKVKLTISRAGNGFSQNVGDEIEVSDAEGKSLIEQSKAIPIRTAKPIEKATKTEKAVKK